MLLVGEFRAVQICGFYNTAKAEGVGIAVLLFLVYGYLMLSP